MVTEQTRHDVWNEMLDIARLVRYYEALADKHLRNYYLIRVVLVFSALVGSATLFDLLKFFPRQEMITITMGLALALFTAWDIVANYARKAAVLHEVGRECSLLEIEWRYLWGDANTHQSDDFLVREKNRQLAKRLTEVTMRAGEADIRENRKLNEKCELAAYQIMREKYAA